MTISAIELDLPEDGPLPGYLSCERREALENLIGAARFQPHNDNSGPYAVRIGVQDGRLVMYMRNAEGGDLSTLVLSLTPYRRIIADYFLMLESYERARQTESAAKLEAIDMGRRGLHNEGAELLQQRLAGKVDMDFETARRFFTLLCVLNKGQMRLVG
jgi:uncharacterized protein (UPF0262 family)